MSTQLPQFNLYQTGNMRVLATDPRLGRGGTHVEDPQLVVGDMMRGSKKVLLTLPLNAYEEDGRGGFYKSNEIRQSSHPNHLQDFGKVNYTA